jgi:hypothetical protein
VLNHMGLWPVGYEGVAGDFSDGGDFEQSKEAEEKGTLNIQIVVPFN